MTALYLLDPEQPGTAWAPFAGVSPIAELRAGGWTIAERWAKALGTTRIGGVVAPHCAGPRATGATPLVEATAITGPGWVVESNIAPKLPMRATGSARRLLHEGRAVAWRLDAGERWEGRHDRGDGVVIEALALRGAWDLVTALEQLLFSDTLADLDRPSDPVPTGVIVIGNPGALSLRGAVLEPGVVIDVQKGAVILEQGVVVKSGSRIDGPSWIRAGTIVNGGVHRQVTVGPECRIHGEISTTVFTGYANKSHDGFVGHSVIGAWVNLGAGTITSNLKNTYGQVRLEPGGARHDTGRQMLGSLIGDHAKTAIGTLLPTGAVVGAGANLFGAPRAPKFTAPFAWGDSGESLSVDQFVQVAGRVMPRRNVTVDAAMEASLRSLYARLRGEP